MDQTLERAALHGHEVAAIAGRAGYQAKLKPAACYGRELSKGRFECVEYTDGLSVHLTDIKELTSSVSQTELSPRLSFIVLVAGELHFTLGETPVRMVSTPVSMSCGAIILKSPTVLYRKLRTGAYVRKVHVTITPQWLEQHCSEIAQDVWQLALGGNQAPPTWHATREIAAAAKAILAPSERPACLQQLFIETQAAVIVSEGLAALHRMLNTNCAVSRRAQQINAVQYYLDTHLDEPLDLAALGRRFGMSTSTLQRYFKQATGMTVGGYIRAQRLQLAREQLLKSDSSVSEVAFAAGYAHVTNFITAYKKQFGCCPGSEWAKSIGTTAP